MQGGKKGLRTPANKEDWHCMGSSLWDAANTPLHKHLALMRPLSSQSWDSWAIGIVLYVYLFSLLLFLR